MKAFIATVASLCLCGILLCFWAYATGWLPSVSRVYDMPKITRQFSPASASPEQVTTVTEDPLCSPCAERMALLLEIMGTEWEGDLMAFFEQPDTPSETAAQGWGGLSSEQREQAKQLFDQYGAVEGLRRFREIDPDAARQFEQRHRPVPSRDVPDGVQSESGSKD